MRDIRLCIIPRSITAAKRVVSMLQKEYGYTWVGTDQQVPYNHPNYWLGGIPGRKIKLHYYHNYNIITLRLNRRRFHYALLNDERKDERVVTFIKV